MSLTTTFFPAATPVVPVTTAAPTSPTADPSLFGWTSVSAGNGTPIYSSESCSLGLTFSASNTYAACCGAAQPCTLYTTCQDSTMLVGASDVTTCALGQVCKTDSIYQTSVDATLTQAIYCGTAGADYTWFRQLPTPGLAWAGQGTNPSNSVGNGPSHFPLATVVGGAGSVLFLILAIVLCICCCRHFGRRSRGSRGQGWGGRGQGWGGGGGGQGWGGGGRRDRSSHNRHGHSQDQTEQLHCLACSCYSYPCNCSCSCCSGRYDRNRDDPYDQNQNNPYDQNQNNPYDQNQNNPYDQNQNNQYDQNQNNQYDQNQNNQYDQNQNDSSNQNYN